MKISELYQLFSQYPHVVTDSRQPVRDSIFFGLRGDRFDGNSFAAEALDKGARYAVVDDPEVARGEQFILVKNSLATLQELSAFHRDRLSIPIIGITGSNGKTTTKEIAAKILSSQYLVTATAGNLNNHIGVPLTLLGMDLTTELGIVEMGANHPGEIALLCNLAKPDYGLVTNIGRTHLEGFGDIEGVKRAKGELFDYLAGNGGLIFCNGGDSDLLDMIGEIHTGISYYGEAEESACSAKILSVDPFLTLNLRLLNDPPVEVKTGLVGGYNLSNILAAVALGLHFRIRPTNILSTLDGWSSQNNRSQRIETESNILIMDAYNANPTSMMAALDSFNQQDHPRKAIILGDMLELGEDEVESHREVLDYVTSLSCEEIFLVGKIFSNLPVKENIRVFPSAEELDAWLAGNPLKERLILLKGSRGIGLERVKDRL